MIRPESLTEFRETMGLRTFKEAAEVFDITRQSWASYERGERPVPQALALAMSAAFHRLPAWGSKT